MLLAGYWLSGLFFVRPMPDVEGWLMSVDRQLLRQPGIFAAYEASPRFVREALELAYVLVYPVIPAAVATLVIGGHGPPKTVNGRFTPWLRRRGGR